MKLIIVYLQQLKTIVSYKGEKRVGKKEQLILQKKQENNAFIMVTRLDAGTLSNIIKTTESKYGLDENSLSVETIRSRIQTENASGFSHQKISPLADVEDLLVDCCCRLSKMGEALTKIEVMNLAEHLICDAIHAQKLID
jgi:hypothetical protein